MSIDLYPEHFTEICKKYLGRGYFVAEEHIPPDRLENAYVTFPIPRDVYVIALIDTSFFGNGKSGLAITDNGLYWRNSLQRDQAHISWGNFTLNKISQTGMHMIVIGQDNYIHVPNRIERAFQLLQDIQNLILQKIKLDYDAGVLEYDEPESEEWMVAVAGQQYGPFEINIIQELVQIRQIRPETAHVWKSGMPEWVEFLKQPEMAALVAPSVQPPPMPPPLPTNQFFIPPAASTATPFQETWDTTVADGVDTPVDFNQATEEQLQELPGIGIVGAKRILQERKANGGFQSADQVGEWLGLKPHQINKLKNQATFGLPPAAKRGNGRMVDY
ncbi:helix-hairpin-helix domain-containing protein [Paenibacillus paeoniae]|uniref:DUF4339 domain-containing protein n=1 Tax=Paenibacillus paeoniae TaxID=2292705 RepID=A0A371PE58_9BACL|nr:helix-hairpin-helix domain-containing protein [Paenibacillus paeoniae]REK74194.1 DUF4339 domain-containing protein [Paenibacillus paeoniae]